MPAMSPTMTEGNISAWKVKEGTELPSICDKIVILQQIMRIITHISPGFEGESFSAGDVLLEIETDKAQMDVEAQEDGKMAKIMQGSGTKGVKVGSRIAVIADTNDDLSTIEIPPEDTAFAPSPQKESAAKTSESQAKAPPPSKPSPPKSDGSEAKSQGSVGTPSKQRLPLLPSVASLLLEHRLPPSEADKIPATGPKGRLLKGDVLAYVGMVSPTYTKSLSDSIVKRSHLDLSNIKVRTPPLPAPSQKAAAQAAPPPPSERKIGVAVNFSEVMKVQQRIERELGTFMPLSTFIARATDIANDDLPLSPNAKPTQGDLFNQILGLDSLVPSTGRGSFTPQINALPTTAPPPRPKPGPAKMTDDIIDILAGPTVCRAPASAPKTPAVAPSTHAAVNVISVTVPAGDERRGRLFLGRVKTYLESEPGRLIL
ncbi:MAG: pyridoxine biosynthesis protein [Geoglossum umbratile]|nr:MAG: pyridoxine biosynthesis protein [Geoglossum umbratile]